MRVKIQRIAYCVQCETILARRCAECVKHPDRKPRIVELYGVPPVLDTNECGCVKLRCQRDGCVQVMWRHPRADGTLGHKNHFCSPECVRLVTAAARVAKRIKVPCSCGCGEMVERAASNMKAKNVYKSQLHHYAHRVQMKADARRKDESLEVRAMACYGPKCRGAVTDHTRLPNGLMDCVRCHTRVPELSASVETASRVLRV